MSLRNLLARGLAAVSINEKWGFVNSSGDLVVVFQCDYASLFYEGVADVQLNVKLIRVEKKLMKF